MHLPEIPFPVDCNTSNEQFQKKTDRKNGLSLNAVANFLEASKMGKGQ